MATKKALWLAEDGKPFDTEEEAIAHDGFVREMDNVADYLAAAGFSPRKVVEYTKVFDGWLKWSIGEWDKSEGDPGDPGGPGGPGDPGDPGGPGGPGKQEEAA